MKVSPLFIIINSAKIIDQYIANQIGSRHIRNIVFHVMHSADFIVNQHMEPSDLPEQKHISTL